MAKLLTDEIDTATWRRDKCQLCGEEIFYLELSGEEQVWWHEDYKGEDHKPVPTRGDNGE